jgi:hypothetical protein
LVKKNSAASKLPFEAEHAAEAVQAVWIGRVDEQILEEQPFGPREQRIFRPASRLHGVPVLQHVGVLVVIPGKREDERIEPPLSPCLLHLAVGLRVRAAGGRKRAVGHEIELLVLEPVDAVDRALLLGAAAAFRRRNHVRSVRGVADGALQRVHRGLRRTRHV